MKNIPQLESVIKRAIVTHPRGSWKWQDAYVIAEYVPVALNSGKIVWKSVGHSNKFSKPQLRSMGLWDNLHHYSLHMKPVNKKDIIETVGNTVVYDLENSGLFFAKNETGE